MRVTSLGYHDVVEAGNGGGQSVRICPARYALDRHTFHQHLKAISEQYRRVTVSNIEEWRPWKQDQLFLTFDDGALGAYTCVADELQWLGWRGHFFITTDWIGKPGFLNRQQIRELRRRGHIIGSHTCSHPARMSYLTWDQLLREWSESCAILSSILGERLTVASVADGYYSKRVAQTAAAAGIEVLFNSEPTTAVTFVEGCMVLGRYSIEASTRPFEAGAIAARLPWPRWRRRMLWDGKKVIKNLMGETYLTARKVVLRRRPALAEGSATRLNK